MLYSFPNIPQLKNIRLEIENRRDKLFFSLSGPRSWLYRPLIWYFIKWHSRLGVLGHYHGANVYSLYIPPIPSHAGNRELETFLNTWLFHRPRPMAVTVAVTDKCQLHCRHCSVSRGSGQLQPLALAEIKRIISESLALGISNITFTGGEPLLRPDLEECIAAVPPDQAVAQVFTNAVLLSPERILSLKKAGLFGLQVSIDSPDSDEHDSWRGQRGVFAQAAIAIQKAAAAGLMVGVSTYASNESVPEKKLTRLTELIAAWGAHELTVFDIIPTGQLLRKPQVMLSTENRSLLLQEVRLLNRRYRNRPRIISQAWTNSGKGFARFIGCLAANYQFHISPYGDFLPCDFTPLALGNIRQETIEVLWKRIIEHPAYCLRRHDCRMQNSDFRKDYIDPIPEQAALPYPLAQHTKNEQ